MSSDRRTEGDLLAVADIKSFTTFVTPVSVKCNAQYADCSRPRFGEFSMWRLICFIASLYRILPIVLRFVMVL